MMQASNLRIVRALAWKEWREQRPLVLAGIALAVLTPLSLMASTAAAPRPLDLAALAGIVPAIYTAMLWPLFSAAAGAATIAGEIGDGTLGFLLSRPASRARIWAVKVAVAFFSGLVILLASLAVASLIARAAGISAPIRPDDPGGVLRAGLAEGSGLTAVIVSGTMLLFATSVFFSTFLPRAMTAAAAGVAGSLLILAGLFAVWSGLELVPRLEADWMALEICAAAGLMLLASLVVFSRGELLRGSGMRRLVAMTAAISAGGLGLLSVPLVRAHGRLTPATAVVSDLTPSPSGDALVATVSGRERMTPQIWLIHGDGSGMERLTGSLTFAPAISPEGNWIAYFSIRGPLGFRSSVAELRAIRSDGRDDHRLATLPLHHWMYYQQRQTAFSPDGERVAALGAGQLVIAPLRGGDPRWIDLRPASAWRQGSLAGWSADGHEVLLIGGNARRAGDGWSMTAVEAATGRMRQVYRAPEKAFIWLPHERSSGWTRVPVIVDGDLLLLDARTGGAEKVCATASYGSPRISDDGDLLVYAVSRRVKGAAGDSEIHLRDLPTGADRTVATVEGTAGDMLLSPSRDVMVVNRYVAGRSIPGLLVASDGRIREMPAGWVGLGWQGRERILMAEAPGTGRLAVHDLSSGETRTIYP